MTEDKSGRELTPREPGDVDTPDASLTPVEGENRDVERFSSGPKAHSVGLTEERSAQIVRSSANARNVIFLAVLLVALFIPVYWFYEAGIPALGTESRLSAEAEAQYVTDVARGYELYQANCAECHGEDGQGGIGPRLNDQGKLYNVVTPAGDPGNGHLNPIYLENVLVVGGRYVCGDPNSLMAAWQEPDGPLNYRQVEELIAWMNASQDVVFTPHGESHGEGDEEEEHSEPVQGWRDPNFVPAPDDTPVPACWKAPNGLTAAPATDSGATDSGATDGGTTATDNGSTAPAVGGTPENPRVVVIEANSALQFLDETGAQLTQLDVVPGETIEFQVDNTAGFDHNFYIGPSEALQVPNAETEVGIPTWQSGVETLTWTVPEEAIEGLEFACTVAGHYQPMHGDIVFGAAAGGEPSDTTTEPAEGEDETADEATDETAGEGEGAAAAGGTPEEPRVIVIEANAALQFLDEAGQQLTSIDALPGETIEFQIENTAGFEHNFYIGSPEDLQVPYGETDVGIPTWNSGVESYIWTVPEAGADGLQFACTVPGHYTPMHGDIVISS